MSSVLLDLRDAIKAQIDTDEATYTISDLDIETAHIADHDLTDIVTKPRISVVGLAWDEVKLTRNNTKSYELPVQVVIKQSIVTLSDAQLNNLVTLTEEILNSINKKFTSGGRDYIWLRNEAYRDEFGTPFNYVALRQHNFFEMMYICFYKYVP